MNSLSLEKREVVCWKSSGAKIQGLVFLSSLSHWLVTCQKAKNLSSLLHLLGCFWKWQNNVHLACLPDLWKSTIQMQKFFEKINVISLHMECDICFLFGFFLEGEWICKILLIFTGFYGILPCTALFTI